MNEVIIKTKNIFRITILSPDESWLLFQTFQIRSKNIDISVIRYVSSRNISNTVVKLGTIVEQSYPRSTNSLRGVELIPMSCLRFARSARHRQGPWEFVAGALEQPSGIEKFVSIFQEWTTLKSTSATTREDRLEYRTISRSAYSIGQIELHRAINFKKIYNIVWETWYKDRKRCDRATRDKYLLIFLVAFSWKILEKYH